MAIVVLTLSVVQAERFSPRAATLRVAVTAEQGT
jgi:hypothetical protein